MPTGMMHRSWVTISHIKVEAESHKASHAGSVEGFSWPSKHGVDTVGTNTLFELEDGADIRVSQ